jgi:hypothetical protein
MPSGTIWGSFTGKSTSVARPYINWSYTQDTVNNKSTITATLVFVRYDGYRTYNNDGKTFTITIDGTNTAQNVPFSMGPNGATDTLFSASKTVTHDDDGEKQITISASGDTGLVGSISLSATITLNTIARASDFTAFTLSNTVLNKDVATTINYTLGRKSTSFSQDMTLKLGSKVIASWNTTGTGALTRALSAAEVNTIITSLPNSTSGTLTLTMQTKSGSTNIGSSKSINEGITLNSAIAPTASALVASIAGTGRDKTINKYVQNISKVTASFTRVAGYGASISSSTIVVKRQSDSANSQTIASNAGTTANVVTLSGVYSIVGTVTDSRGRTATVSTTITVEAYSSPSISKFTVARISPTTTVSNAIIAAWSALGTSNPTDITVVGVNNVGTSATLYSVVDSTAGSLNTTRTYTNQSDASSYTYTITVTDSFGKEAKAVIPIGTTFVEFTIAKGKGIGVGKVWEEGALDVGGAAYINGTLTVRGNLALTGLLTGNFDSERIPANADLNNYTENGFYYCPANADAQTMLNVPTTAAFSLFVEQHAGIKQTFTEYYNAGYFRTFIRNKYSTTWGPWVESIQMDTTGSNSNGWFMRYSNGTQICHVNGVTNMTISNAYGSVWQNSVRWTFPVTFISEPVVIPGRALWGTGASWATTAAATSTYADIRAIDAFDRASSGSLSFTAMAIGRWK